MRLPERWPALAGFMVTSSMIGMTLSFNYPLLTLVLERHGAGADLIGLNAAVYALAVFVLAPWLPRLINRLGPVLSIVLGQVVCIACFLILPLRVDLWLWSGLRFLLGAGVVLVWVASEAAVNALAGQDNRARIVGVYATLFCIGCALGPLLIPLTGTRDATPFLVCAGLIALSMLPLIVARGAGEAMAAPGSSDLPRVVRQAPRALGTILAYGLVETTLFALMPLYSLALGHDEATTGLLLSAMIAGNIVFQLPIGWGADRWSRSRMLLACTAIALTSLLFWPLTLASLPLALPLLLLGGGALGGLYTLSLTLLGERFRGSDLAVANTAFVLMYQLGAMIGPVAAGTGMRSLGAESLPLVPALVLALCLGANLWRQREPPGGA